MDNLLLIFLVMATFVFGYYVMKKMDDVLDANDSTEKKLSMLPEDRRKSE